MAFFKMSTSFMLMFNQPLIEWWNHLKQKMPFILKFKIKLVQNSLVSWEDRCWTTLIILFKNISKGINVWKHSSSWRTTFRFGLSSGAAQSFMADLKTGKNVSWRIFALVVASVPDVGRTERRKPCLLVLDVTIEGSSFICIDYLWVRNRS